MVRVSAVAVSIVISVGGQSEAAANKPGIAQGRQKPVREEVLNVSYRRPPDTVPEMMSASRAVVVAEWTGQSRSVETAVSGGGIPLPKETAYTFRIVEIIELDPLLPTMGGEIEFRVIGGEEEFANHVKRTKNLDALNFQQHRRYVMFIGLDPRRNELHLMWGPLSVYDITGRNVTSLSASWKRHNGTESKAFLGEVRESSPKSH